MFSQHVNGLDSGSLDDEAAAAVAFVDYWLKDPWQI